MGLAPIEFDFLNSPEPWFRFGIPNEELPPLRHTEDEVTGICELFGDQKSAKFLREKATRSVLKDRQLTTSRFLHIATHGISNEIRPFLSGLLLTPESQGGSGFLSASEVLQMQLTCEMVVLSACETGLGKLIRGEGLFGLTQAFFFAGAEMLTVSLWRVDDLATAELMKQFYKFLAQEGSIGHAEALRKAKQALITEARKLPQYRHLGKPYYWAPFVLVR